MDCSTPGWLPCPSPSPRACSNSGPLSQWCHPIISSCVLLFLLSIFPRVFCNKSALHMRWPKYCSFSFSISPSNEYSGLISFRIDGFDLLAVHGTLKSLLWQHNLKASILQRSAIFMVQLSKPYMTIGKLVVVVVVKAMVVARWTFVHKLLSLLFNMLSR